MTTPAAAPDLCHRCGEGRLVADMATNSGNLTCNSCGRVAYENPMVSEVQFGETSAGGAVVQGQMVGAGQARAPIHGRQNAMESREQTLNNARRNIRDLAAALRIPDYICESACAWFEIALNHNFVQGRRSQNVLAACLYIACRKERTHHMLIDFSSKLQLSVFSLGATFLKMVRTLNIIKLPLADPSIFIAHFAEKLEFDLERKNGKIKVIKDALQLAKRMSDDSIHEGRRPAGIAGACILIAARMNGFRRTHTEIVSVAHVSEDTLQTRLKEFSNTTSGSVSVHEFRKSSSKLTPTAPPSLIRNKVRESRLKESIKARKEELKALKENNFQPVVRHSSPTPPPSTSRLQGLSSTSTLSSTSNKRKVPPRNRLQSDNRTTDSTTTSLRRLGRLSRLASLDNSNPNANSNANSNPSVGSSSEGNRNQSVLNLEENQQDESNQETTNNEDVSDSDPIVFSNNPQDVEEYEQSQTSDQMVRKSHESIVSELAFGDFTPDELKKDITLYEKLYTEDPKRTLYVAPSEDSDAKIRAEKNRPRNLVKHLPNSQYYLDKISSSENIDDVELTDAELNSYINDEKDFKKKETAWLTMNHDYLIEQEKKRLKLETDELAGNTSSQRKKARSNKAFEGGDLKDLGVSEAIREVEDGEPSSAAESVQRMLRKKPIQYSKKINYDQLPGLFD